MALGSGSEDRVATARTKCSNSLLYSPNTGDKARHLGKNSYEGGTPLRCTREYPTDINGIKQRDAMGTQLHRGVATPLHPRRVDKPLYFLQS